MRAPELSPRQREMRITRFAVNLGRVIGTAIGCLLGMFPLLFLDAGGRRGEDVVIEGGGKADAMKMIAEEAEGEGRGGRGGGEGGSIFRLAEAEGTAPLADATEEGGRSLAVAKASISIAEGAEREGGGGGGKIVGEMDGRK